MRWGDCHCRGVSAVGRGGTNITAEERVDTVQARVFLQPLRICALKNQVCQIRGTRQPSIWLFVSLLGRIEFSFEAVPYALFLSRPIQDILLAWNRRGQALDYPMLSPQARLSLSWWLQDQNLLKGRSFLLVSWSVQTTDASLSSWGATLEGFTDQGRWSRTEPTHQHPGVAGSMSFSSVPDGGVSGLPYQG